MPTRRGRAGFEADVGREPDQVEPLAERAPAQQGGETAGYGDAHAEDRDRSGSRGGSQADTGRGGTA